MLVMSTAYSMVTETLRWQVGAVGIEVITVPIVFPVQDSEQIVLATQAVLEAHPDLTLCVFSHISSMVRSN